ncbi:MAG: beta-propeller fold lactonase family protein [Gemmatimonadales bacterium]|nr:beta-propeller fold lactonase family protein [Gemmatimonadales bacterium]
MGAVYVSTNSPTGNEVLMFPRDGNGRLGAPRAFATGGLGTGGGLGNQGAVVLNRAGGRLFAVNAGSNQVSVFAVRRQGLELLDRVWSGGTRPVSIAVHRRLVYVLNAGGAGNIRGFVLDRDDNLRHLAGSTRGLSSSAAEAAQVAFSPDGALLVVTEKATNVIGTYTVGADGRAIGPNNFQPSAGATPFGFAFRHKGMLVVSEAFAGAADASALSSYRVGPGGTLSAISPSVGTTETAACWVVVTRDGGFAYTSNTGSNAISGYRLSPAGELRLLDADGVTATTQAAPIDLGLTNDDRFLYSLDSGAGTISAFRVKADGSLAPRPGASGLPAGANGLAAR